MSCLSALSSALLILGILACLISFCAPFWVVNKSITTSLTDTFVDSFNSFNYLANARHEGLWAICTSDLTCNGIWENNFYIEKSFEDWKKAAQGLYAVGALLLLISIFITCVHVCCCQCSDSYSIKSALGSLVLAGVLCVAAALGVYGGFMYKDKHLSSSKQLDWGFWCGVGGVGACLVSSFLFFLDSCCGRRHVGFHMTRVV